MKFAAQLSVPRIDVASYQIALHEHMCEVIGQALLICLEAVFAEIPVWSVA